MKLRQRISLNFHDRFYDSTEVVRHFLFSHWAKYSEIVPLKAIADPLADRVLANNLRSLNSYPIKTWFPPT
ncbi:hypothetical protein [Planktothricoides sp. SR001]|uniref:hypothetical protein n=1 Tax=Planktothricoides sp. SR001 TaxID=1705388 RepID=UPI0012E1BB47|nr:hypothetical protein [Planktothricoides sp. SR001]